MSLFYHPSVPDQGFFTFDASESKHLLKVLRNRTGDEISVTSGKGVIFKCVLHDENLTGCSLEVVSSSPGFDRRSYSLHIAVSLIKNPSRFEWFLEKATEIGIEEITPVICKRTERQQFKAERYRNLLISAIKQSGRSVLPALHQPVSFNALVAGAKQVQKYIAWCDDDPKPLLKNLIQPGVDTLVLIGPEGDFSEEEVLAASEKGFQPVSLGDARLRTETAALSACFTFNMINH